MNQTDFTFVLNNMFLYLPIICVSDHLIPKRSSAPPINNIKMDFEFKGFRITFPSKRFRLRIISLRTTRTVSILVRSYDQTTAIFLP